jgi:putative DNA primase/helicase
MLLVIAEGYATAASISQELGFATISAFDAGNLEPVARALQEQFPDKPIIIMGDDDKHLEITQGINPGKTKAMEAATAVNGVALFPIFAPGEQVGDPKSFSDFNDLASKSLLGSEGLKRQIKGIVDKVIQKKEPLIIEQKEIRITRQQHSTWTL